MANNAQLPQITLLLTRPRDAAQAFWQALPRATRSKLTPMFSPLIQIVAREADFSDVGIAIFTSANAPGNAPHGNGRTAYCVGEMTTQTARHHGWNAICGGRTAEELITFLYALNPTTPLTHLSGTHTRGDVVERLYSNGCDARRVIIYDQMPCPLIDTAKTTLNRENPVILPLFSPRTARQFVKEYQGRAPLHVIALSTAVADEMGDLQPVTLDICTQPTRNAMLEAVQNVATRLPVG